MNQTSFHIKDIKCTKHKYHTLDAIDLTGNSPNGRMCLLCIQQSKIPYESYLQVSELFGQQQGEVLSTYPPFKNQKIRQLIQKYCDENMEKESIDSFFCKLREDIEAAIQLAENKAKQSLIKNQDVQRNLIKEIAKISETDKLKQLLITGSEKLNEFLQEKWKSADQNEKKMQSLIDEIKLNTQFINLEGKQKEANQITQSLQQFNLFDPLITILENKNVNFIKSTYGKSQDFITLKTDENYLQFINTSNNWGQAFLDFVLDPKIRYSIQLNYQPKAGNESYFLFGIVDDEKKDSDCCHFVSEMSYFNGNGGWGIGKYLKGPNITGNQRKHQKEEFEVRIFLEEKILKVASFPEYKSVIELDDINKIQEGTQYRFFVILRNQNDMIEISKVEESNSFENDRFQ